MDMSVTVVIPTYNAGDRLRTNALMLKKQTADIKSVLIIDSSSEDNTVQICKEFGFNIEIIKKKEFGHGKTRQYALSKVETEIVVFLTQDALLVDEFSIEKLVAYLCSEKQIAAVYGRQIPCSNSGILACYSRLYNYPMESKLNTFDDKSFKGIKTAFLSNSFSAYKKSLLINIGGFPEHINFGEDMYIAAKFLMAGYKTGYCAEASVYHSHDYTLKQDYMRSKDIGEFHKNESWILEIFGQPEKEGLRFVVQEVKFLLKNYKFYYLPLAFLHNFVKMLGYRYGYFK